MNERIWLKEYPDCVPADIDVLKYKSVVDLMEEAFLNYSSRVAYSFMGTEISFAETDRCSKLISTYLQSLQLNSGDRVAIMMPNVPQYPIAVAAVLRAGLVVVNVNPLYTSRELEFQLKDSGAKAIVILENFAATLAKCMHATSVEHVILCAMGDRLGWLKGCLVNFVVRHIKKRVPTFRIGKAVRFNDALKKG